MNETESRSTTSIRAHVREVFEDGYLALNSKHTFSDHSLALDPLASDLLEGLPRFDEVSKDLVTERMETDLGVESEVDHAERATANLAIKDQIASDLLRHDHLRILSVGRTTRLGETKDLTRNVDLVAVAQNYSTVMQTSIVVHRAVRRCVFETDENVPCIGFKLESEGSEVSSRRALSHTALTA